MSARAVSLTALHAARRDVQRQALRFLSILERCFRVGRDWRLGFGRSQKCPGKATGLSARVRWDDAIVQIYLGWKRESDFIENETQLASLSLGPRHAATSRSNSRDTAW